MATKQTTLRLGETTLHHLNYLMWVARLKSQAEVVRLVVDLVAKAVAADLAADDPELFYHGGTVLTAGEQQAYQRLVTTLQAFAQDPAADARKRPVQRKSKETKGKSSSPGSSSR